MFIVSQEFLHSYFAAFVLFVILFHVAVSFWILYCREPYLTGNKRAFYALIVLMSAANMIVMEDDITGSLPEALKLWTLIIAFGGFTLQVIMTFMAIRKPEREPENRLEEKLVNLQERRRMRSGGME